MFWLTVLKITRQDQVVPLLWNSGEVGCPHGHAMGSGKGGGTHGHAMGSGEGGGTHGPAMLSGEGRGTHGHVMGSGVGSSTNSHAMTKRQREAGLTWVLQWHLRACPHVIQTSQRPTFYEVIEFPRHHAFNTGAFGVSHPQTMEPVIRTYYRCFYTHPVPL